MDISSTSLSVESKGNVTDRYQAALAASKVTVSDETVANEVKKILEKSSEYNVPEVWKFLLGSIDLTTLSTEDSEKSVARFTQRVNDFDNDYPQYRHVAAICVYSNFAEVVKTNLDVEDVDVCVVAGCFPSSQAFVDVKVADVALAVANGAQEVDVVLNIGMFNDENYEGLCDELIELKHAAKNARLKVILETGCLKTAEKIRNASILSMYCDADFIKTSTGKIYPGASLEAAYVMCQCIKEYYEKTGRKVGFKAAGGVRTTDEAVQYYTLVKEILGDEWLNDDLFRIGASSLANNILSSLEGETVKFF
jgi:deoxyribose-phosphate aldolase